MIYQKRGRWCARIGGQLRKFDSEEAAKAALGIVQKPMDPLAELANKGPVYESFEEAVEAHGDDDCLTEDEEQLF